MKTLYQSVAEAAKGLKAELKAKFPKIKFSVKSKSYTGGSSIDVEYIDGPPNEAVNAIAKKYQYGDFDGMQDLYEYSPTFVKGDNGEEMELGGAKYVFVKRHYTNEGEMMLAQIAKVAEQYGVPYEGYRTRLTNRRDVSSIIYEALGKADLSEGLKGFRFEKGELIAF